MTIILAVMIGQSIKMILSPFILEKKQIMIVVMHVDYAFLLHCYFATTISLTVY